MAEPLRASTPFSYRSSLIVSAVSLLASVVSATALALILQGVVILPNQAILFSITTAGVASFVTFIVASVVTYQRKKLFDEAQVVPALFRTSSPQVRAPTPPPPQAAVAPPQAAVAPPQEQPAESPSLLRRRTPTPPPPQAARPEAALAPPPLQGPSPGSPEPALAAARPEAVVAPAPQARAQDTESHEMNEFRDILTPRIERFNAFLTAILRLASIEQEASISAPLRQLEQALFEDYQELFRTNSVRVTEIPQQLDLILGITCHVFVNVLGYWKLLALKPLGENAILSGGPDQIRSVINEIFIKNDCLRQLADKKVWLLLMQGVAMTPLINFVIKLAFSENQGAWLSLFAKAGKAMEQAKDNIDKAEKIRKKAAKQNPSLPQAASPPLPLPFEVGMEVIITGAATLAL